MHAAAGQFHFAGEDLPNSLLFCNKVPQWLLDTIHHPEPIRYQPIPLIAVPLEIARAHRSAAVSISAGAGEIFFGITRTVVDRDFFSLFDVSNSDFKIKSGSQRRGVAGMVYEATMVPAKNQLAP